MSFRQRRNPLWRNIKSRSFVPQYDKGGIFSTHHINSHQYLRHILSHIGSPQLGDTPIVFSIFSMDHIFGDSDDIDFGSTPSSVSARARARTPLSRTPLTHSGQPSRHSAHQSDRSIHRHTSHMDQRTDTRSLRSEPSNPTTLEHSNTRTSQYSNIPTAPTTPALSRLISGMKSSFLPREDDMSTMRMIALSAPSGQDPLFMIRQDDTTFLL